MPSLVEVDSGQILRRVKVGEEPEGVTIHPDGKEVYVTNERDSTVSVLDVEGGAALAQIPVCIKSGGVSVIDTASGVVAKRIAVGGSPWGVAVR